ITIILLSIAIQFVNAQQESEFCVLANKRITNTIVDSSLYNGFFHEFKVLDGSNYVFVYIKREQIYSSIETDIFLFEIPKNEIDSFKYKDNEVLNTNAVYFPMRGNQIVYPDSTFFNISKGIIKGKNVDENNWDVSINILVKINNNDTISFSQCVKFSKCDSIKILSDFF